MTTTRIAILWHMHQPVYRDPLTGTSVLPWVRLHALKDYWGMVSLLSETPAVHVTFNLVPSLLDQVEAYARGEAREIHQDLSLKPAADLTEQERIFVLTHFFPTSRHLMENLPRLAELKARATSRRDPQSRVRGAAAFTSPELRDLQVLSKLAWFDRDWVQQDAPVAGLIAKGRGFSEEDKRLLADRERALLNSVIPAYREAAQEGRIELSTSPYFHPILPLLCDTEAHHEAHPGAPLPTRYRHPEDAGDQIRRALARHREIFGETPAGVWPSEGSISEEAVLQMAMAGVRWTASDEGVLERSLGQSLQRDGNVQSMERLYRPWLRTTPSGGVRLLFRDRHMSDLIGFSYARRDPREAAADLLGRFRSVGKDWQRAGLEGDPVVGVFLDGENAWEHYPDGGRVFLRALYQGIEGDPALAAVTVSEALECAEAVPLPRVAAGSWIHADFSVWIGHADDRRAWDLLGEARAALERAEARVDPGSLERAWGAFRAACGSDWCWWYGDDRSTEDDSVFDRLFRRSLQAVYLALGLPVPEALTRTLITTRPAEMQTQEPSGPVVPEIDGRLSSAEEWAPAGVYRAPVPGAMAHSDPSLREIRFGVGKGHLNLLMETSPSAGQLPPDVELLVSFPARGGLSYRVVPAESAGSVGRGEGAGSSWVSSSARAAADQVVELAIPLSEVGPEQGVERLRFQVLLLKGGDVLERHPEGVWIGVDVEEDPHES